MGRFFISKLRYVSLTESEEVLVEVTADGGDGMVIPGGGHSTNLTPVCWIILPEEDLTMSHPVIYLPLPPAQQVDVVVEGGRPRPPARHRQVGHLGPGGGPHLEDLSGGEVT